MNKYDDGDFEKEFSKQQFNKKHRKHKDFQDREKARPPKKKYKRIHRHYYDEDDFE